MRYLVSVLALGLACAASASAQKYQCVPDGFSITDKTVDQGSPALGDVLKKLKARCTRGTLKDKKNKTVRLVRREGCWGNPPADYQEILQAQSTAIAELRKKYTVIEVGCQADAMTQ